MIVKKSTLDLKEYFIINNSFEFSPSSDGLDSDVLFSNYLIDIDYAFKTDDDISFQIYTKIEVNFNGEYKGYLISVEGVGFFEFGDLELAEKVSLLNFSALAVCINNLRNYMSVLTSHSALGKYLLPSIDLNDLIDQKKLIIKKVKENQTTKKKKL